MEVSKSNYNIGYIRRWISALFPSKYKVGLLSRLKLKKAEIIKPLQQQIEIATFESVNPVAIISLKPLNKTKSLSTFASYLRSQLKNYL